MGAAVTMADVRAEFPFPSTASAQNVDRTVVLSSKHTHCFVLLLFTRLGMGLRLRLLVEGSYLIQSQRVLTRELLPDTTNTIKHQVVAIPMPLEVLVEAIEESRRLWCTFSFGGGDSDVDDDKDEDDDDAGDGDVDCIGGGGGGGGGGGMPSPKFAREVTRRRRQQEPQRPQPRKPPKPPGRRAASRALHCCDRVCVVPHPSAPGQPHVVTHVRLPVGLLRAEEAAVTAESAASVFPAATAHGVGGGGGGGGAGGGGGGSSVAGPPPTMGVLMGRVSRSMTRSASNTALSPALSQALSTRSPSSPGSLDRLGHRGSDDGDVDIDMGGGGMIRKGATVDGGVGGAIGGSQSPSEMPPPPPPIMQRVPSLSDAILATTTTHDAAHSLAWAALTGGSGGGSSGTDSSSGSSSSSRGGSGSSGSDDDDDESEGGEGISGSSSSSSSSSSTMAGQGSPSSPPSPSPPLPPLLPLSFAVTKATVVRVAVDLYDLASNPVLARFAAANASLIPPEDTGWVVLKRERGGVGSWVVINSVTVLPKHRSPSSTLDLARPLTITSFNLLSPLLVKLSPRLTWPLLNSPLLVRASAGELVLSSLVKRLWVRLVDRDGDGKCTDAQLEDLWVRFDRNQVPKICKAFLLRVCLRVCLRVRLRACSRVPQPHQSRHDNQEPPPPPLFLFLLLSPVSCHLRTGFWTSRS